MEEETDNTNSVDSLTKELDNLSLTLKQLALEHDQIIKSAVSKQIKKNDDNKLKKIRKRINNSFQK